jgi:hypothetical protein
MKDGAHTHGHGDPPVGLGTAILVVAGAVMAASVLERVLTAVLIGATVAAGLLVLGLVSHVVAACRRYQQHTAWLDAVSCLPPAQATPPGLAPADPVILRQALADLLIQQLADHAVRPADDSARHQHLHLHGLTPDQAAAILTALDARHHAAPGPDGGSQ